MRMSNSKSTPCCSKVGLRKGQWTAEEDEILTNYIKREGEGRWRTLPKRAGLLRCGKSCRLRWLNYLKPSVKRGRMAPDEEDLILRLHRLLGNRWSLIAGRIPGRTDNEIKNYWNSHLRKKLISQGIDPNTHKPIICAMPNSHIYNGDVLLPARSDPESKTDPVVIIGLEETGSNSQGGLRRELQRKCGGGGGGNYEEKQIEEKWMSEREELCWFVDTLMNEEMLMEQEDQEQQQSMNVIAEAATSFHPFEFSSPMDTTTNFNFHGALWDWETEVLAPWFP